MSYADRPCPDEDLLRVVARHPHRWSPYAIAAAGTSDLPRLAEEWTTLLDDLDAALSKALPQGVCPPEDWPSSSVSVA
jgi:hypothetical protein